MGFRSALMCVGLWLMAACAAVPRPEATALADAGKSATTAFRAQLVELRGMLTRANEVAAFQQTYEACTTIPADRAAQRTCEPAQFDNDLLGSRDALSRAIDARIAAISALAVAYEALRQEALYDASADLSSATSALAQSVSAVPGAGAALETPIAIAPQLAGWLAADMQNQRLRDGSEAIRNAVQRLAPALTEERRIYVGFAEDFATREADVRAAIIESGLSPSQRSAERLVTSLGLPLASNSEAIIARSPALQAAIASADAVAARDRVRLITRSYETSEAAMTALVAAHLRFEQSREPDLADLNRTLGELTAIISALRAGEAAPAAPAG